MRRPRINYEKINLDIKVHSEDNIARIEYYTIDACKAVITCKEKDVVKKVNAIQEERNRLCIWHFGKETYPMREK